MARLLALFCMLCVFICAPAAAGEVKVTDIYAVVLMENVDEIFEREGLMSIEQTREKMERYDIPIGRGPIGFGPAFHRQSLTTARALDGDRGPESAYLPILGRFWTEADATKAIEELGMYKDQTLGIVELPIGVRAAPGDHGYSEIHVPLASSEIDMLGSAGWGVYVRDDERPRWEPRSIIFLGLTPNLKKSSVFQWPVEVVACDRGRDRVVYCEAGSMRTKEFTVDPQPIRGQSLENPESTMRTVRAALGNPSEDHLIVMRSLGLARVYQWIPTGGDMGRVVCWDLDHRGAYFQVERKHWEWNGRVSLNDFRRKMDFEYSVHPTQDLEPAPFL